MNPLLQIFLNKIEALGGREMTARIIERENNNPYKILPITRIENNRQGTYHLWIKKELDILLANPDISNQQMAIMLGLTARQVADKRHKIKKELSLV